MSRTRDQLEAFLGNLNINADYILDVGGSQRPIENRLASCQARKIEVFDLARPHEEKKKVDHVGDLNLPVNFHFMNMGEGPDLIFCLEVFDYIWDPMTAAKNLFSMLRRGGMAYVSFPFIYPVHNPMKEDMLRYTEFGAKRILQKAGFEIVDCIVRTGDYAGMLHFFNVEGMRAAREYDKHNAVGFIIQCRKPF